MSDARVGIPSSQKLYLFIYCKNTLTPGHLRLAHSPHAQSNAVSHTFFIYLMSFPPSFIYYLSIGIEREEEA